MEQPEVRELVLSFIMYVLLPMWGIAGFVDWCCHRATQIEKNSGIWESLIHSIMGVQVGLPILICLIFEVNVLALLLCFFVLITHEIVAHHDVHFTAPLREISIWEVHAHNYLATIPFYMVALTVMLRWETFIKMITLDWSGEMSLVLRSHAIGHQPMFVPYYLGFMCCVCVIPYIEELYRCYRYSSLHANIPAEEEQ